LLHVGEFGVQVLFVDGVGGDVSCDGFGDLVADFVLFAEVFPGKVLDMGGAG
jgi:hypothetical protein